MVRMTPAGPCFAMIRHRTMRGELVWGLPKGEIEDGESPQEAALREVREETGVVAEIVDELDKVTYWFSRPKDRVRIRKTVQFFLMRAEGGNITDHDDEVEEVRFFALSEALDRTRYDNEVQLLKQADHAARSW